MKIALVGAGRMGCLIGTDAIRGGAEVYFIDPYKPQIDAINEKGITIYKNDEEPYNVKARGYYSAGEVGKTMDLVILQVSGAFTEEALKGALCLFDEHTYCMTLQNGMGSVEIIEKYVPRERILYGIIHFACMPMGLGESKARINAGDDVPFCCAATEEPNEFMREFAAVMARAGREFNATTRSAVDTEQWTKLAKNCSSNPVCCVTRLPLGPANESDEGYKLKCDLYNEVRAVAAAKGITIPDMVGTGALKVTKANKIYMHVSSTAQDVKARKRTDIDYLSGYIAAEGARLGIPTPINSLMTVLVHLIEQNYELQF